MESPLSFNSTENFRKKLLAKNLPPYNVDSSFTANGNPAVSEFNIVDYSIIDSDTIENIGNVQENNTEEGFDNFLENKKKKLEKDKSNYSELLKIWYKDGQINQGEELSTYPEFIETVGNKYSTDTIKIFLTLCHYLDISLVNGKERVATKSYEDAKIALENYMSLDTQK